MALAVDDTSQPDRARRPNPRRKRSDGSPATRAETRVVALQGVISGIDPDLELDEVVTGIVVGVMGW